DRADAHERAAHARLAAGLARAGARAAQAPAVGVALVDAAVAVLIDAVAGLGVGDGRAGAHDRAGLAALDAHRARADGAPAAAVPVRTDAVAGLGVGHARAGAHARAGLAALDAHRARADVAPAAAAALGIALVDEPVAVVVAQVAGLERRARRRAGVLAAVVL